VKDVKFGWNAGEFGPEFWGRSDIERYALGAARIENFQVNYSGAVVTGPRTQFVDYLQDPDRAVRYFSFEFSSSIDNAYLVVFSGGKIRFVRDGAYILEDPKAVSAIVFETVTSPAHGYTDGDLIYVDSYPNILQVTNATANTWQAVNIDGNSVNISSGPTLSRRVLTLLHPYTDEALLAVKTYQVYDQIKFTHPDYSRYLLTRTSSSWTFLPETLSGGVPLNFSVTGTDTGKFIRSVRVTAKGSGYSDATVLTVTDATGVEAKLTPTVQSGEIVGVTIVEGGRNFTAPTISGSGGSGATFDITLSDTKAEYTVAVSAIVDGEETGICRPTVLTGRANFTATAGSATYTWPAVAGAESYNVYRSRVFPEAGQASAGAELFFIGNTRAPKLVDANIQADTTQTPRFFRDPFAAGAITYVEVTAGGSGYTHTSNITVTDATGSGFVGYPIVSGGAIIAVYIANPGSGYTAPTFSVSGGSGATLVPTLSPATGQEPATSFIFQNRAGYAGGNEQPVRIIASRVNEFDNFSTSRVVTAADSYEYSVDNKRLSPIRHTLPVQQGLLVFTRDGVALLRASDGRAVTPTDGVLDPQSYIGAADTPPEFLGEDIIHIEEKSRGVRMLVFNAVARKFEGQEISFFSRHLFETRNVVAMAQTYGVNNRLYLVFDDGTGCVATVQREQQTYAFTRFTTPGLFEAVASLNVGKEEHVYFAVTRGSRRAIEYIRPNDSNNAEDVITLDGCISTPKHYPAASLTVNGNVLTATAAVFSPSAVGQIIGVAGGLGIVSNYLGPTSVSVTFYRAPSNFLPQTSRVRIAPQGSWWMNQRVSSVSGIPYEGETVQIIGDGKRLTDQVVVGGAVTLSEPSAIVRVGFGVEATLTTLSPPQVEGQLINVIAVAVYFSAASSLTYGKATTRFTETVRRDEALAAATALQREGERFVFIDGGWDRDGKISIGVPKGGYAEILRVVVFYEEGTDAAKDIGATDNSD
jgi:hypothetical protein